MIFTSFNVLVPADADYNGQLSDGSLGGAVAISTRRTIGIFDFAISPLAQAGDEFDINFAVPGSPNPVFNVVGTDLGTIELSDGRITIVSAVPEPSAVSLLIGAMGMIGLRRRRS